MQTSRVTEIFMPFKLYIYSSTPATQFMSWEINVNSLAQLLGTSSLSWFVFMNCFVLEFCPSQHHCCCCLPVNDACRLKTKKLMNHTCLLMLFNFQCMHINLTINSLHSQLISIVKLTDKSIKLCSIVNFYQHCREKGEITHSVLPNLVNLLRRVRQSVKRLIITCLQAK